MITYPTLYKRTSTGKIQTWFAEVEEGKFRSTAGFIDGKKTTTEWTICKGKNLGKANGTTPETQAIAEVDAQYKKKQEKEYFLSIDDIDQKRYFKPMLARKWGDMLDKIGHIDYVYMQPKLDGVRCIFKADGLWSRQGKPLLGTPHIHEFILDKLGDVVKNDPDFMFDGELYNHDFKDDFNKIISMVRKQKPSSSDLKDAEELIQHWVYDIPSMTTEPFSQRLEVLSSVFSSIKSDRSPLVQVETKMVKFEDIDETALEWIAQGYEGAMVRLDRPYETERSESLLKWKEFQDAEFLITDVLPGRGGHASIAASVIFETKSKKTFNAGILGTHEYCAKLLADKDLIIGKMGTVVFQNLTPDGIPRFGKFKAVRDYE